MLVMLIHGQLGSTWGAIRGQDRHISHQRQKVCIILLEIVSFSEFTFGAPNCRVPWAWTIESSLNVTKHNNFLQWKSMSWHETNEPHISRGGWYAIIYQPQHCIQQIIKHGSLCYWFTINKIDKHHDFFLF